MREGRDVYDHVECMCTYVCETTIMAPNHVSFPTKTHQVQCGSMVKGAPPADVCSSPENKNSTKKSPLGTHRYLAVERGREERKKGRKRREGIKGGRRVGEGECKGGKGTASLFLCN